MVPQERLELSRLAALASKTSVSAIPPPGQYFIKMVLRDRIELPISWLQIRRIASNAYGANNFYLVNNELYENIFLYLYSYLYMLMFVNDN